MQDLSFQHWLNAALQQSQHHHNRCPLRVFTKSQTCILTLKNIRTYLNTDIESSILRVICSMMWWGLTISTVSLIWFWFTSSDSKTIRFNVDAFWNISISMFLFIFMKVKRANHFHKQNFRWWQHQEDRHATNNT